MKQLQRTGILLLILILLIGSLPAFAATYPSAWAQEEVVEARSKGLIPLSLLLSDYNRPITRSEMCDLLITVYTSQIGEAVELSDPKPFSDTDSPSVAAAYELGIVNGVGKRTFAPDRNISRQEAAKMISILYSLMGDVPVTGTRALSAFSDADSIADWAKEPAANLVEKGILKGKEDGAFHPNDTATVEESILIVNRMIYGPMPKVPQITSHTQNAVISSRKDLILTWDGMEESEFSVYLYQGTKDIYTLTTKNSTATISKNYLPEHSSVQVVVGDGPHYSEPVTLFTDELDLSLSHQMKTDTIHLSWAALGGDVTYQVTVMRNRNTKYAEGRIQPETKVYTTRETYLDVPMGYHQDFKITVSAGEISDSESFSTGDSPIATNGAEAKENLVFPDGRFETEEDALLSMENITVPIWRLKNGQKVSGTTTLTVHAKLAPIVEVIFQEIYDSEEAFPFNAASGYTWRNVAGRDRLSEHAYGTAIDINPNENYCLYASGSTTGKYWKPGEDPYSVSPYGDVVRIFEKYGFTWGGDAWRGTADYMHFSYFGT